ncbi:MAG: flippase [Cyclobacteriaceae bacterium]|nr:flippase [Cyclobacteriaceae bacterium]
MKNKLQMILGDPNRRVLIINYFSLAAIQGANYLIPLLVLPYIVRIIGPAKFGLLMYAQTFVYYFTLIINYSFDYTATRDISLNRNEKEKISNIFSSVFLCKLILLGLATVIFSISILFVEQFEKNASVYWITYLINIGFVLFPSWYLQGIEKLSRTAFFNFFTKLLFAIIVIAALKEEDDFLIYTFSAAIAQIFVGLAAFIYCVSVYKIHLVWVSIRSLKKTFKSGLSVFLSNIIVSLYTTTNLIVLGFFASEEEYGHFSASLKIATVTHAMIVIPLGLTLFPYLARRINESKEKGLQTLNRYIKWVSIATLGMSAVIFLFAEQLILLLFGDSFLAGVLYLRVMAFMPFISGLNNLISVQGLLNLKMDKEYLFATLMTLLFSVILNITLVPHYKSLGTSVIQLACELLMVVVSSLFLFGIIDLNKWKSKIDRVWKSYNVKY